MLVLGLGGLALLGYTPWVAVGVVAAAGDRRRLLPPDLRGLSQRRRRLRGQPRQPGRERVAHRRLGAADRLRADGGGVGRRRRRGDHQRGAGAWRRTRSSSRSGSSSCSRSSTCAGSRSRAAPSRCPPTGSSSACSRCSPSGLARIAFGDGITAESAGYELRHVDRDRRASLLVFLRPARVRLGLHRADRGRGGLQRRARLREAEEPQRRGHAGDHGRAVDHDVRRDHRARDRLRRAHGRGHREPDRLPRRGRAADGDQPDRARDVRRDAAVLPAAGRSRRRS